MKDFNISTGLVVVPFAHLLLASTFLYAYCFGFGANIASFVAVTDIFATSISSLAPLYGLVLISALFTGFNEIRNWVTTGTAYPNLVGPQKPPPRSPFSTRLFVFAKALLLAGTILPLLVDHLLGRPMDFLLPASAIGFSFLISDWLVKARTTPDVMIALLATIAIFISLVAGFETGQANRHGSFKNMAEANGICGEFVVLRRFSDMYLVLGKDGQHRLIDKDCKPQFALPRVKPHLKTKDLPKGIRWFFDTPSASPSTAGAPAPKAAVTATMPKLQALQTVIGDRGSGR